ncbi:PHD and RING finger domain-containing protein 1 [Asbolus verrucosus]|uniref:PHD and RING finger domain-containing protein 1 n=1 Tax=Asbolus verrucosus TaxID=1661398 RepID=A0A482VCM4_ASBVE|nr:PHD and RING finger domain-containing protein 1 [Asbolus verrucosus]
MSDDSDSGPQSKHKRKIRRLEDSSSSSNSAHSSPVVTTSRRKKTRFIKDDSDSDSGSSIELPKPKRKTIPRVASDAESDSSGSVIIKRAKRPARVVSDSDSDSEDSDHGFEGSSSSQWETDFSDTEAPKLNTAKVQDTGVDSDSSDGQSEKCPICLISLTTQEIGTPESCDHVFCVECIQEWSKNMNTCPVDRQEYQMILVRKNINGSIYKQIPIQPPNPQNEVDIVEDPTFCEICGQSDREDRMLLCDGCDLGFHLECLNPPLLDVPTGAWFCNDCSPEDLVDPEIELYELQLLLDDANDLGRPRGNRRIASSRLVPRTRQSERVRRRIVNNRNQMVNTPEQVPNDSPQAVSSTTSRPNRRNRRKRKRKPRYRLVYKIDEATGETIAVKERVKKRRKKKRQRLPRPPKTVKKRLALQLGICAPRNVPQNLPDVRVQTQVSNIQMQRFQAGIPTLHLFGHRDELDYFSESENEIDSAGVIARRAPNRMDVATFRRARVKAVSLQNSVSSSSDILDSILDSQTKFHSKSTKFSLGKDGKVTMEESNRSDRLEFDNYEQLLRRRPTTYSNNSTRDSVPSSSGRRNDYQSNSSSLVHSNSGPTSTVETSSATGMSVGSNQEQFNSPQDYTQTNLCTIYDVNLDDNKDKPKKNDDVSESNTPRSGTPASESEIDIYSDIETVSTSKVDESDFKISSPLPAINTPNTGTDDENNDSEPDMVIDTEKANPEPEESTKEETTVTSTVDSNTELTPTPQSVTSTFEIQSQAVQSSNQLFDDKNIQNKEDDEDSEDGCPNFSIYSKESITMAKNTDITLGTAENEVQQTNQVGEISSSPAVNEPTDIPNASGMVETKGDSPKTPPKKKITISTGLYSDSEDETIVKKGIGNSFGISDIRNMTEDISEEERSYTPCLDERAPLFREGIEGLETEMISDEDRNDFDESHDLKTVSDGDALEINAKESELDFTRPEDYEEGEIVDKSKTKKTEEPKKVKEDSKKPPKKKDEGDKSGNKENESQNSNTKDSSGFKKLSKNNKERNYREKDRERSRSRDKKDKDKKDKKKEKRKEIERYDVRALIAEKPRRMKDKFGRDVRRSASRSKTRSPTPRRSVSRNRRSPSKNRRSVSKTRRSLSKRRSLSRERNRKKRRRSRRRSLSRSKSRSVERKRSRSKTKKRRRSPSRERRRKSRERSKGKSKKHRSRSRHRSRSLTPKRPKDWGRRHSRDWTPSLSRSRTPEPRHLTPSWTPPRIMDNTVKPHNLTVILTNDANKKKKEKKRKAEKKTKENERQKKRKRNDRTPPPSKEVFASGDNILVSVSFNKDNETRDVSTKKRREAEEAAKKNRKEKNKKNKRRNRDLTGIKPVAIIDLERSPFKELTPSPKDVIVLSDSDNEEARSLQKGICDSSQQVASPERCVNSYTTGPKTPPEPQVKFTLASKQTQMRAISNPLHEPDDIEPEGDTQEVVDGLHKGPNTPPEPPNSPPSSPDVYDPFEPTKSRSPTPEPMQTTQSNSTLNLDDNRDDSIMETRAGIEIEKSNNSVSQTPDALKSHTPPLADVQPADSQSSIQVTPESSLGKSPERSVNTTVQTQTITASKPVAQTIPFSSVPTSIITSTPVNSSLAPPRINILNTTIITPPHVASSIPQRIVLPNTVKSSPVKISPTKPAIKSTPIKPMPSKTANSKPTRKSNSRNQNGSDTVEANLSFDSPYSPGSSDYEDLFEPPVEAAPKPQAPKPVNKNVKSPNKIQNAFDALFGSSPFNKIKTKQDNKTNKYNKKSQPVSGKGKDAEVNEFCIECTSSGTKQVGVKLDEDNLKILDELPNSAVEMQVKDKFLKKLNRQERVVEEVKLVLKPHYNKKHINKEEYKDILRRAVPKICHNKSGEINPTKIKNLIEAYVKKVRHSKKVTSSSSSVNPQKA